MSNLLNKNSSTNVKKATVTNPNQYKTPERYKTEDPTRTATPVQQAPVVKIPTVQNTTKVNTQYATPVNQNSTPVNQSRFIGFQNY